MATLEEQKIAAYGYLISLGVIPPTYLDESRRDFESGDVFFYAVPATPQDARRALDGLTSRLRAATDDENTLGNTSGIMNPVDPFERNSLEVLGIYLLTLQVPKIFAWQIDADSQWFCALLLGQIWNKEMEWLPYWLKKAENDQTLKAESIAAFIFTSPLMEFGKRAGRERPICEAFYKWLVYKAEYQAKKGTREVLSLDEPTDNSDSDGTATTLLDFQADPASEAEFRKIDRDLTFEKLLEILSPKEKAAVIKFKNGETLTATERRAKNRAVQKMKAYCRKHNIAYPG